MDVHSPAQRSLNMSRIQGRDTRPEILIRRGLHSRGYRFRLHARDLPGRPDIVLPKFRAVVFVNGCFWHGHDCPLFRLPATRTEFWEAKIVATRVRDQLNRAALQAAGWRSYTVWECALRGRAKRGLTDVLDAWDAFRCSPSLEDGIAGRWEACV